MSRWTADEDEDVQMEGDKENKGKKNKDRLNFRKKKTRWKNREEKIPQCPGGQKIRTKMLRWRRKTENMKKVKPKQRKSIKEETH